MEVLLVGGACLTSALGAALACGGLAAPSRSAATRRVLGWSLRAMRLLRRLSRTRLADVLLGVDLWRVHALRLSGSIRRRLQDLGLVAGTRVTCIQRAAAGDPTAYLIRGAVIALRQADAARIEVGGAP